MLPHNPHVPRTRALRYIGASVLVIALLAMPPLASAQTSTSPADGVLDMVTWVTNAILDLVDGEVAVFLAAGFTLAKLIAVYLLMVRGATYMLRSVSTHWPMTPLDDLGLFLGKFLAVLGMLHYYNSPLPGVSFSFHQIFTHTATALAGIINETVLNDFFSKARQVVENLDKPSFTDFVAMLVYWTVLGQMALVEALLFFILCFGYVAAGLGALLGPLFIPFYMWPTQAGKFFRWIDYMAVYAFYQVVAAGFVAIWVRVMVYFIDHSLHGDYTIAHFTVLFVPFLVLNLTFVFSMFRVPAIAAELFGGIGSVGAQIGASITSAIATATRAAIAAAA